MIWFILILIVIVAIYLRAEEVKDEVRSELTDPEELEELETMTPEEILEKYEDEF